MPQTQGQPWDTKGYINVTSASGKFRPSLLIATNFRQTPLTTDLKVTTKMSSSLTPLVLYGHWAAPNPFKVAIVLKELELSYEYRLVDFSEVKQEAYVKINPNGRLPALVDPNTNITIWESGAIILYLIDQYDKQGKLSSGVTGERYAALQWLMFQVSGMS